MHSVNNIKMPSVILASDGQLDRKLIDYLDIPFYGGWKYLIKDKIFNTEIQLKNKEPLIYALINACIKSEYTNNIVILCDKNNKIRLEDLISKISTNKKINIITDGDSVGEKLAHVGIFTEKKPFILLMPDLPYVDSKAIDLSIINLNNNINSNSSDIIFTVMEKKIYEECSGWPNRYFLNITGLSSNSRYYRLSDVMCINGGNINEDFATKFYAIRQIRSLKGKIAALTYFNDKIIKILFKKLSGNLDYKYLQDIFYETSGMKLSLEPIDKRYYGFAKDIDTSEDYKLYKNEMEKYSRNNIIKNIP